jgi:two-component system, sensor histidine kinase and response regulator
MADSTGTAGKIKNSSGTVGPALRVLLAETDESSRKLVTQLLEIRGHRVSTAGDGLDVISMVQDAEGHGLNLLLLDTAMPSVNGLEVTRAIRQIERARKGHLPIIAMGTRGTPHEETECLEAGVDAYLAKPIHANILMDTMDVLAAQAASAARNDSGLPLLVFDQDLFMSRLDEDENLAREVVGIFLAQYPKLIENVHRAAEERNAPALERSAHSLKGSLTDIAATEAVEAARKLEDRARNGNLDAVPHLLAALDAALSRLMGELRKLVPPAA